MPGAARRKETSHQRIIEAASRRFRTEGLEGAGVVEIMAEAGLTHGGFYAHFRDKVALIATALEAAMAESRKAWLAGLEGLAPAEAYRQILGRYLSRAHRNALSTGCPMPALGSEIARQDEAMRQAFEAAFVETVAALERHMPDSRREQALASIALCLGGLLLSRMVVDRALADAILLACRRMALATLPNAASLPPVALSSDTRSR